MGQAEKCLPFYLVRNSEMVYNIYKKAEVEMGKKKHKGTSIHSKTFVNDRLNDILKIKANILKCIEKDNFDRSDVQYPKEIKKIAARELDDCAATMKKSDKFDAREVYKLSSHYRKRRENAIVKYAPEFAERFEKKYEDINIERRFIDVCTVGVTCVPDKYDDYYLILAIALFILDDLRKSRNIWEAMLYIPDSEELLCDVELPDDYIDAEYEDSLIKGMMYLIMHRDDEEDTFLNAVSVKRTEENVPKREYIESDMYKAYIEDYDKFREEKWAEAEKMSCRERLDKVLSFMQPVTIERAEQRFKEKMFEFTDILLARYSQYETELKAAVTKCADVCDEIYAAEEKLFNAVEKEKAARRQNNVSRSSILSVKPMEMPQLDMTRNTPGNSYSMPFVPDEYDEIDMMMERVKELHEKLDRYDDEQSDVLKWRHKYTVYAVNCLEDYAFIAADFIKESEQFKAFRVDNPYETCFAFFSLLDSGSDIVWLVPLAGLMLRYAAELLPWTKQFNQNLEDYLDFLYEQEDDEVEETSEEESTGIPEYIEREARLYSPDYTDYSDWMIEGIKRVKKQDLMHFNFPQLIYRETGVNLSRNTSIYEEREKGFLKSGISKKNIELFRIFLSTCGSMDGRIGFRERNGDTEIDDVENTDTLKSIISSKSSEIVQLKTALHKAENELKNEKKRSEKILSDTEMERRELTELRELIYNLQNNVEGETASETEEIQLPYTAKSNIVIFGGHESWLRAFRPLVKNVRIIDPHTNPDINLIRNADVVWMQTNAMPHSYYNKIMDIVRLRKIPVKYFAYASAEKCARQLAAEDLK